jgi:hypothetical protein
MNEHLEGMVDPSKGEVEKGLDETSPRIINTEDNFMENFLII